MKNVWRTLRDLNIWSPAGGAICGMGQSCRRKYVTGEGVWDFVALPHFRSMALLYACGKDVLSRYLPLAVCCHPSSPTCSYDMLCLCLCLSHCLSPSPMLPLPPPLLPLPPSSPPSTPSPPFLPSPSPFSSPSPSFLLSLPLSSSLLLPLSSLLSPHSAIVSPNKLFLL